MLIQLLSAVVTGRAQGLEPPGQERVPVTAVRFDVIGDGRRRCDTSIEAEATERFPAELGSADAAPTFKLIPASPILIEPWG
jgi:hypothetical protein